MTRMENCAKVRISGKPVPCTVQIPIVRKSDPRRNAMKRLLLLEDDLALSQGIGFALKDIQLTRCATLAQA